MNNFIQIGHTIFNLDKINFIRKGIEYHKRKELDCKGVPYNRKASPTIVVAMGDECFTLCYENEEQRDENF